MPAPGAEIGNLKARNTAHVSALEALPAQPAGVSGDVAVDLSPSGRGRRVRAPRAVVHT